MDLHYSQTEAYKMWRIVSLNPLWIYTTLKQSIMSAKAVLV